jgi:hypothetical protein
MTMAPHFLPVDEAVIAAEAKRNLAVATYRAAYEAALDDGHWITAQALRFRLRALEQPHEQPAAGSS